MSTLDTLQRTLPPYFDQSDANVQALIQAMNASLSAQDTAISDMRAIASFLGATGNDVDYLAVFFGLNRLSGETDGHLLQRMSNTILPRATQFYFPQVVEAITGLPADMWTPGGAQLINWDVLSNFNWDRTTVTTAFTRNSTAYDPYTNTTVADNEPTWLPVSTFPESTDTMTAIGVSPASTNLVPYSNLSNVSSTSVWSLDVANIGTWQAPVGSVSDLAGGVVTLSSTEDILITGNSLWTGELTARLEYTGSPALAGIVMDSDNNGNCYYVCITGTSVVFGYIVNGAKTQLGSVAYSVPASTFVWLRIQQSAGNITVWYAPDSAGSPGAFVQVGSVASSEFASGKIGLIVQGSSGNTVTYTTLTLSASFPTNLTIVPTSGFYDAVALNASPGFVIDGNTVRWQSGGGNVATSINGPAIAVSPSTTYAVSIWVLAPSLTGTANLQVYDTSAATTTTVATIQAANGWVRVYGTYTTGATATTITPELSFPASAGGYFDFGFFQIETPVVTPYIQNTSSGAATRAAETFTITTSLPIQGQGLVALQTLLGNPGTILEWSSGQLSIAWTGTEIQLTLGNGTDSNTVSASLTEPYAWTSQWHTIIGVWGNDSMSLWVDGTEVTSTTLYAPITADNTLYVGSNAARDASGGYFADLTVSTAALPSTELRKWSPTVAAPVFLTDNCRFYAVNGTLSAFRPGILGYEGCWGFAASGLTTQSDSLFLNVDYLDNQFLAGPQSPQISLFGNSLAAQTISNSNSAGQQVLPWVRGSQA